MSDDGTLDLDDGPSGTGQRASQADSAAAGAFESDHDAGPGGVLGDPREGIGEAGCVVGDGQSRDRRAVRCKGQGGTGPSGTTQRLICDGSRAPVPASAA